jgi:hypothetical protein
LTCSYETPRATPFFPVVYLEYYAIRSDEYGTGVFSQVPRRKGDFHLVTFILRGTWANWHNLRQGYNLDELINQSEPTRDLASHKELGVIRKLARMTTRVFGARHSPVRAKRCYGSKISKGGLLKVTSGLMGSMRKGHTIRCLSNGRKRWEVLPCDPKEFKTASRLSSRNWGVKGIML